MSFKFLKRGFLASFIFILSLVASPVSNFIIKNEDVLPKKTVDKINEMGSELKEKTGINVYLAAIKNSHNAKIKEYEKNLTTSLQKPYILLTILLDSKKVDIVASDKAKGSFDREQVLSPWPWSGTIIPLLTSRSKDQKAAIEAALLNGYADIVDQVASSYSVELKSSIGSGNKNTYLFVKLLFYGTLFLIFANFLYHKFYKNKK